ncbi:hypothetical protein ACJX0J_011305, partial [Zea mays]
MAKFTSQEKGLLKNFIKNVYVERRYSDQRIGEHLAQIHLQDSTAYATEVLSDGIVDDKKLQKMKSNMGFA